MSLIALYILILGANKRADNWDQVWSAVKRPFDIFQPALATLGSQNGPPIRMGRDVLIRFHTAEPTSIVYLAGNFNHWADANNGRVGKLKFAMHPVGKGQWFADIQWPTAELHYKFVLEDAAGKQTWVADPNVLLRDPEGNSVVEVLIPEPKSQSTIKPAVAPSTVPLESASPPLLVAQVKKVWVRTKVKNEIVVNVPASTPPRSLIRLELFTPMGTRLYFHQQPANLGPNLMQVPPFADEGGYRAVLTLAKQDKVLGVSNQILSVTDNLADDLRYGFYANYSQAHGDYAVRADMFANLHINGIEYYDYFPAHGNYAPDQDEYLSEPFKTKIDARDVRQKIDSGHQRNILSLAYVASYAASESVYKAHPFPMTDSRGVPKVFNGDIMPEDQADLLKKPKWFWLMDVSRNSSWDNFILGQFQSVLTGRAGAALSFDGFELDTYGDPPETRFYAKGSPRNGDLLRDVLHDFVSDVWNLTHTTKPDGLVSFNSVNEFASEEMHDVTDFSFLEIWRYYCNTLEGLVNLSSKQRAALNRRVVLKLYPKDMEVPVKSWPPQVLRRLLGATMTGGGSLMVAGEPDDRNGQMHALSTLYYPDNEPLSPECEKILRDYYAHDALLYGYTHGKDVTETSIHVSIPEGVVRVLGAPKHKALVVQILRTGSEGKWSVDVPASPPAQNVPLELEVPGGKSPRAVYYVTPDVAAFQLPVRLPFDLVGTQLRLIIPQLNVHGTVIIQY